MRTPKQTMFSGIEGLCVVLRRLAYPNRYEDLRALFHRPQSEMSRVFNSTLKFIYRKHCRLVQDLNHCWLREEDLWHFADVLKNAGCPYDKAVGFIDGTIRSICRPYIRQERVYSGYKKMVP